MRFRGIQTLLRHRKAIAILAVMVALGSLVLMLGSSEREIKYVRVTGDISSQQRAFIEKELASGEIQLTNIRHVKDYLEKTDWVSAVQVVLKWPDELSVQVEAEVPIAYWNDDAFINSEGIVFKSDLLVAGDLPQLYGPVGRERLVMSHYQKLNRALSHSGHFIEVLSLNERGSLAFEDQSGVRVALGNVDVERRVKRFLKVSASIAADENAPPVSRIDTRYTNGVAVAFVKHGNDLDVANTY